MKSSSSLNRCWNSWFQKDTIVRNLEFFQNFIVVSLCVGLFCVMLIRLDDMFLSLLKPINFEAVTSDILFILILVEIFRLLIIYLQEQRISIGAAVEVSLVSALREVILQGVLEIPLNRLFGACAFLVVLGGLLFLRVWMFQRFDAIKQTKDEGLPDNQHSQLLRPSGIEQYPF
ncbi:MAG: phosphate-starvation-inducible PsiE family protein [Stigonema ocellatum SAG 48.90 = DSM 106950]|nr:phosphate-starvation-inducible PsiE family protein [Stigonema ocellatum SAG 48.90 = DSM 106950]